MIFTADSSVLVIFAKRPKVGVGKQRIAADLGKAAALELSELLLAATLEDAAAWPGPVVIAPADDADSEWAATLLPEADVVPQRGNNLGERINHVDRQLRAAGAEGVVFIGSDSPGHNATVLTAAQVALDGHDAVLIPAHDGGVTLMGSRRPWPELGNLPWETDGLCAALQQRCRQENFRVGVLPPSYDVDRFDDLLKVQRELQSDQRSTRQALADWIRNQPQISIIVPVRQDTDALDELLGKLSGNLRAGDEIVVVAAGQSSTCADLCNKHRARLLHQDSSRGMRMNCGATAASNPVLWFLHADADPAAEALQVIRQSIRDGAAGGYFRFRFRGQRSLVKRLLEGCINLRTRLGIPYADQGLFMTRQSFEEAGGFADQSLFEEVALVRTLRDSSTFIRLRTSLGVSPRRWEKDGWWRRTLQNRLLVIAYRLGVSSDTLARLYRQTATATDQRGH